MAVSMTSKMFAGDGNNNNRGSKKSSRRSSRSSKKSSRRSSLLQRSPQRSPQGSKFTPKEESPEDVTELRSLVRPMLPPSRFKYAPPMSVPSRASHQRKRLSSPTMDPVKLELLVRKRTELDRVSRQARAEEALLPPTVPKNPVTTRPIRKGVSLSARTRAPVRSSRSGSAAARKASTPTPEPPPDSHLVPHAKSQFYPAVVDRLTLLAADPAAMTTHTSAFSLAVNEDEDEWAKHASPLDFTTDADAQIEAALEYDQEGGAAAARQAAEDAAEGKQQGLFVQLVNQYTPTPARVFQTLKPDAMLGALPLMYEAASNAHDFHLFGSWTKLQA
jgi:hypothetical protein